MLVNQQVASAFLHNITIADGARLSNHQDGAVNAAWLSLSALGTLQLATPGSPLTVADRPLPVLTVEEEHYSKELDLLLGFATIKNRGRLAGETLKDHRIGAQIAVEKGGTFAFSYNENALSPILQDAAAVRKTRRWRS